MSFAGLRSSFWKKKGGGDSLYDYSDATLVYSIQKLVPSYTGDCWLVRRVSDSAIQAIGFDSNGLVDEAELSSFLGTGIGRLVTFYDQVGSNDATAPSTATEPKIWDNGFILSTNGHPSIDFEGTANLRKLVFSEIELISTNGSFGIVACSDMVNSTQGLMGHDTLNRQIRVNQNTTPNFTFGTIGSPNDMAFTSGIAIVYGTNAGFEVYKSPNQGRTFAQTLDGSLTSYTATTWKLNQFGAVLNVIPYSGYLQEFIFYNDITTIPSIPNIKTDRITYFS